MRWCLDVSASTLHKLDTFIDYELVTLDWLLSRCQEEPSLLLEPSGLDDSKHHNETISTRYDSARVSTVTGADR